MLGSGGSSSSTGSSRALYSIRTAAGSIHVGSERVSTRRGRSRPSSVLLLLLLRLLYYHRCFTLMSSTGLIPVRTVTSYWSPSLSPTAGPPALPVPGTGGCSGASVAASSGRSLDVSASCCCCCSGRCRLVNGTRCQRERGGGGLLEGMEEKLRPSLGGAIRCDWRTPARTTDCTSSDEHLRATIIPFVSPPLPPHHHHHCWISPRRFILLTR